MSLLAGFFGRRGGSAVRGAGTEGADSGGAGIMSRGELREASAAIGDTLLAGRKGGNDGGFYRDTQIAFAYNSNTIEGGTLSRAEAADLFDGAAVAGGEPDDILEMENHFRLFDLMLDTLGEPLSAELIQRFHAVLKHGTSDDLDPGIAVGGWKTVPNSVGNLQSTSAPQNVARDIDRLLSNYHGKAEKDYSHIAAFHAIFERIHPFQDGNGRTGRVIAYRECLANGLIPFLVTVETAPDYYRGLSVFDTDQAPLENYIRRMAEAHLGTHAALTGGGTR